MNAFWEGFEKQAGLGLTPKRIRMMVSGHVDRSGLTGEAAAVAKHKIHRLITESPLKSTGHELSAMGQTMRKPDRFGGGSAQATREDNLKMLREGWIDRAEKKFPYPRSA